MMLSIQICNLLGLPDVNAGDMLGKLEETVPVIKSVNEAFKDPVSNLILIFLSRIA